ncbi:MAG: hypothetical protein LBG21_04185 [Campylobacteraceae bacterium]|nr:hypothetical protein [Campylobacteraceae bacterium]
MKKFSLFLLLSIFFLGCSNKSGIHANIKQEQAIVSTQKAKVSAEDNSTMLLMATYLNNIQKYSNSKKEMIILSYYYSSFSSETKSLGEFAAKLNDKNIEIIKLENGDELLKDIPINNTWSKHYLLLSTQQETTNILKLTVEIYPFPPVLLELSKEL